MLAGSDLHLIDVKTARELRSFTVGSAWSAWQIAANPKQMVAATIDLSGNASVLSLADGHEFFHASFSVRSGTGTVVLHVGFSPDGRLLAITTDNAFQLWDWAANRKLLDFDAHAFHKPDLSRSVTVGLGSSTRQSTAEVEDYFWFTGASFSPDGKHLALTSHDELKVLDLPSGKPAAFTRIDSGMIPGCIFIDNDHIFLPQINLDLAIYSLSKGMAGTTANVSLQDYLLVPGRDRGVVLAVVPYLVAASTFATIKALFTETRPPESLTFTHDGKQLLASTYFKSFASWSLDSGEANALPNAGDVLSPAVSADGKYLAAADFPDAVRVFELTGGHKEAQISMKFNSLDTSLSISSDGAVRGFSQKSGEVDVFSVPQKTTIATLTADHPTHIAVQPDGSRFAVADSSGTTIYSVVSQPAKIASLPIDDPQGIFRKAAPYALAFSPDGKWLAIMETSELRLVSTQTWTEARKIEGVGGLCIAFSPDSLRIALPMQSQGVEVVDVISGRVLFQDNEHLTSCPMAFSADGSVLAAASQYGTELFSTQSGQVLANLYLYSDESQTPHLSLEKQQLDWLVVTPDGLFDGTPFAWNQLTWRISDNTFDLSPVEIFFQNFYRPGLLAEIASGRTPKAPTNIANIDRRQPRVALTTTLDASTAVATRTVHLDLSISEVAPDKTHASGSGVRDVHLFRNGVLVQAWRGDMKLDKTGKATFSADIPIAANENRFTAYAFSGADIKSSDASLVITGADTLRRQGTAWIISTGINHYADATPENHLDLNFAEGDAADFASHFSKAQAALGQSARVRRIDLLGLDATKANLQSVFRLLSGASADALTPEQQQFFSAIAQVQPEDGVFVFYAGHGAAQDNHFYLIPQDFHFDLPLNDPRSRTISDIELGHLLEGIAPARSFLIIDACNSGQAIDSSTPVGPVNATGLAQLAYEKGLYILAASKDSEPALETHSLGSGHGFLTYALVNEGLREGAAAENGLVELRPWFTYAGRRVPELQAEQLVRRALLPVDPIPTDEARQHPRIFYRREPETNPFVIAKTASSGLAQH